MIKKSLITIMITLLVFGLTACKNGNVDSPDAGATPQSDTISYASDTLKEVKQYDAQGRKAGFWTQSNTLRS